MTKRLGGYCLVNTSSLDPKLRHTQTERSMERRKTQGVDQNDLIGNQKTFPPPVLRALGCPMWVTRARGAAIL
ncbi:Hypp7479 [Branchiostoma lanceolatum]|uniref:Hypp7479 protein n=1 Tax=Branchiostoma lanceolatum TaxID=7740 RepID=A0A8K0EAP8_BRALA|nr:Hypp7479 [Branchiostoma lanceolatum]